MTGYWQEHAEACGASYCWSVLSALVGKLGPFALEGCWEWGEKVKEVNVAGST